MVERALAGQPVPKRHPFVIGPEVQAEAGVLLVPERQRELVGHRVVLAALSHQEGVLVLDLRLFSVDELQPPREVHGHRGGVRSLVDPRPGDSQSRPAHDRLRPGCGGERDLVLGVTTRGEPDGEGQILRGRGHTPRVGCGGHGRGRREAQEDGEDESGRSGRGHGFSGSWCGAPGRLGPGAGSIIVRTRLAATVTARYGPAAWRTHERDRRGRFRTRRRIRTRAGPQAVSPGVQELHRDVCRRALRRHRADDRARCSSPAGVSAFDVVFGLLLGNLLAVLSWMFLTAPIATRARLTLYYQLEKICGRKLVTLYNLANGVMFCFLAGSMITVSATAVGVWFNFPMPGLNDVYPNSVGWVLAVLAVGSVISVVAAYGYEMRGPVRQHRRAVDGAGVPGLRLRRPAPVHDATASRFARRRFLGSWPRPRSGRAAIRCPGQIEVHLLARHVLRLVLQHGDAHRHVRSVGVPLRQEVLVRRSPPAAGMYVGHFMAWISASILYALQLHRDPANTDVLPGPAGLPAPPASPG